MDVEFTSSTVLFNSRQEERRSHDCQRIDQNLSVFFQIFLVFINVIEVRNLMQEIGMSLFDLIFDFIEISTTSALTRSHNTRECRIDKNIEICALGNHTIIAVDLLLDIVQHEIDFITSLCLIIERTRNIWNM